MNEQEYIHGMLTRTGLFMDQASLEKVRNTTFAIAGIGGVGAITAELLARWGVKKFRLLDMDKYEPTNLNRQLFATSKTLGQTKVETAAARIKEINPFAEIEITVIDMVTNENAISFVQGAGIVIQNADRPSAKLLYLAARDLKVPLVNGYATITGGRVQAFDYRKSACESVIEKYWHKYKMQDLKPLSEMSVDEVKAFDQQFVHATAPSLNFVTNMVGCLIVAEAVKMLTEQGRLAQYPWFVEFDTFTCRMRRRHSLSPFEPGNVKRIKGVVEKVMGKKYAT
ncbi:HesA/MoeB/ThiF family protein [Trichloromonas sp.]|uniref:HesA/MoeB/ThiF family protein n=1 Tax=Trichloromonas sp. TaxID=3069249 RepID=UPI003D813FB9